MQEGDEVITINNIPVRKITNEQFLNHYKLDTVLIDIIREGKPLTIAVPVDKNEEQVD